MPNSRKQDTASQRSARKSSIRLYLHPSSSYTSDLGRRSLLPVADQRTQVSGAYVHCCRIKNDQFSRFASCLFRNFPPSFFFLSASVSNESEPRYNSDKKVGHKPETALLFPGSASI